MAVPPPRSFKAARAQGLECATSGAIMYLLDGSRFREGPGRALNEGTFAAWWRDQRRYLSFLYGVVFVREKWFAPTHVLEALFFLRQLPGGGVSDALARVGASRAWLRGPTYVEALRVTYELGGLEALVLQLEAP